MKTVKLPLFAGVICAVAFCLNAKDIYVDCNDPHASDTAGEGRGGELLPYATIQAAVDAAEVDATIKVKPGEYKEGYKITPKDQGYRQTNRVYIAKSLRIESTEGAAVTKVVGFRSVNAATGAENIMGNGMTRCFYVDDAATNTVIKGFTITKGATQNDYNDEDRGGGVRANAPTYVVDCVITGCGGKFGSALYGGKTNDYCLTAIRCRIDFNQSGIWESGYAENANLWNCIVRERLYDNGYRTIVNCVAVNTTFVTAKYHRPKNCTFYNSLINRFGFEVDDGGNAYYNSPKVGDTGVDKYNMFAPWGEDFALFSTSPAVGAGVTANIRGIVTIPEEFAASDFEGNMIGYTAETCNAGCVQRSAGKRCGTIMMDSIESTVDSHYTPANCYVSSEDPLHVFEVEFPFTAVVGASVGLYPMLDGVYRMRCPPVVGQNDSYWFYGKSVTDEQWVSDEDGDDNTADGTEEHPYKTIQAAVNNCLANTAGKASVIKVKPGTYSAGALWTNPGSSVLNIVGVGGADNTVIEMASSGNCFSQCNVRGFTIKGVSEGMVINTGALVDCIVTGCDCPNFITDQVSLRTRFTGNTCGKGVYSGTGAHAFCTYASNTVTMSGYTMINGGGNPILHNCTFIGNTVPNDGTIISVNAVYLNNCIIDGNGSDFNTLASSGTTERSIVWNSQMLALPDFIDIVNPLVFPGDDTLPISSVSPAVDAANYFSGLAKMANFYKYSVADVAGRLIEYSEAGDFSMGANQFDRKNSVVVSVAKGGVSVTGANLGENFVDPGDSLAFTVSPEAGGDRIAIGVVVNGSVTNLFENLPGGVWSHTVSSPETSVSVEALYSHDLYVNPAMSDANDGFTPETAKKTLVGITAITTAGDVIHAAAGTYNELSVLSPGAAGTLTKTRCILPAGVSLVSDGGKSVTFIEGEKAAVPDDGGDIRGIYMYADTRVEGFTFRKCACFYSWDKAAVKEDVFGGSVKVDPSVANSRALIVGCHFEQCYSGCGQKGTYIRCTVPTSSINSGTGINLNGFAFRNAVLVNCLLPSGPNQGSPVQHCDLYNCVVKPNYGYFAANIDGGAINAYNSIFHGPVHRSANLHDCLIATNSAGYSLWGSPIVPDTPAAEDVRFVSFGEIDLESTTFLPNNWATSILRDAGDSTEVFAGVNGETDLVGAQRVYNGDVDIGCYEYDYREDAAALFNPRRAVVVTMDPQVTLDEGNSRLAIADGASVVFRFQRSTSGSISFNITLDGGAEAEVFVNGVKRGDTVTASGEVRVNGVGSSDVITVHIRNGSAYLKALKNADGMVYLYR